VYLCINIHRSTYIHIHVHICIYIHIYVMLRSVLQCVAVCCRWLQFTWQPLRNVSTVLANICTAILSLNIKQWLHSTGWRRLIGSLKLQIISHKRATKYKSLLRKMTYKDKGSYESSPPCNMFGSCIRHISRYLLYIFSPSPSPSTLLVTALALYAPASRSTFSLI